ncbi:MAG TPA: type II secretion system F family protein [Candidatus Polarisedimenticolia bacterium]|nr:type II secretion system F family protein [Candidatus Polarisedimenticolia bacterium]
MPEFIAKIGMTDGTVTERSFVSESEKALRLELQHREYLVFDIRKRNQLLALLPGLRAKPKVKSGEFLLFNQELAALVKAGLPIVASLDLLLERRKNPVFRKALTEIRDQVKSGVALSEAFEAQGGMFPAIYSSTLASGERSGEVASVLKRFVTYQKMLMATRRKVTSALVYPACLLLLSVVIIFILVTYVVPKFVGFYSDMQTELPLITRLLIGVSEMLTNHLLLIAGIVIGAVLAVRSWVRTEAGRLAIDRFSVKLPLVGGILHRFAITRFVRTVGTLIAGGIPVVSTIGPGARAVGNLDFQRRLEKVERKVREGAALWSSLEETGLFNDLAIEMTKVGESTGSLNEMLQNVSEFYEDEIDSRLSTVMSLLEPLMLIIMGIIVAGMLLAIYLPLMRGFSQPGA